MLLQRDEPLRRAAKRVRVMLQRNDPQDNRSHRIDQYDAAFQKAG